MEGKYGAVSSSDLKNWTDISSLVTFPVGMRHGTILKISSKELKKIQQQK